MATGKPIGSFYVSLGLNTKEFQRNLKRAERDLYQAFGTTAMRTSQLMAAAMAGIATAIAGVGVAAVKMAADLERSTVSFARLLGSADAADKKLRSLQEFAARTPYTFTELVDYEKRLIALGFQADATRSILRTVGDTASGLGLDQMGVQRLIKAFGDIKTKGVVATQEMKQFGEVGVNANKMLAEYLLGSESRIGELQKMIENRLIPASVALEGLFAGMDKQFGGMMMLQSETMIGRFSTIRDESENILRIIGRQIIASTALNEKVGIVRDAFVRFRQEVDNAGFQAAISNLIGDGARVAVVALAGAITGVLIPAMISFGITTTLAGVPLAGLSIAGTALAVAGIKVYDNWSRVSAAFDIVRISWGALFADINVGIAKLKLSYAEFTETFFGSHLAKLINKLPGKTPVSRSNRANNARALEKADVDYAKYVNRLADEITDGEEKLKKAEEAFVKRAADLEGEGKKKAGSLGGYLESFLPQGSIDTLKDRLSQMNDVWAEKAGFLSMLDQMRAATGASGGDDKGAAKAAKKAQKEASAAEKRAKAAMEGNKQIYDDYARLGASKEELLLLDYKKELRILEKTKKDNKDFTTAQEKLWQMYYIKRSLLRAEQTEAETSEWLKTEQEAADRYFEIQKGIQDGSALESELQQDRMNGDLAAFVTHLNAKTEAERASLEGRRDLLDTYNNFSREAHRTEMSYMAEGYNTLYNGLTNTLTDVITGAKSAGEAFKALGLEIIQMFLKWQIQQRLASVFGAQLQAAAVTSSVASAAVIAAAWAIPAWLVNMATFGAGAASAHATGMMNMARVMSPIPFAEGGIVNRPTLAMIGEKGESEAVIPLSKLSSMMGNGGGVVVNVHNNTGVQATTRQQVTKNGQEIIVDLFMDAYARDVNGLRSAIRG